MNVPSWLLASYWILLKNNVSSIDSNVLQSLNMVNVYIQLYINHLLPPPPPPSPYEPTCLAIDLLLKIRGGQRMWWWEEHQPRELSQSTVLRGLSESCRWSRTSSFWALTAIFSSCFSIYKLFIKSDFTSMAIFSNCFSIYNLFKSVL